jgi:hypothetical protein
MGSAHSLLSAHGENRGSRSRRLAGRRRPAGEGRADVLAGATGKPIGGSNGEGAHRSLAHDGDGGRHRGAPVSDRL